VLLSVGTQLRVLDDRAKVEQIFILQKNDVIFYSRQLNRVTL
jgi:hypothetical protein